MPTPGSSFPDQCRALFATARQGGNQGIALFCLGVVVANQAIFRLGAMSPIWALVLVLTIATLALLAPNIERGRKEQTGAPRLSNILIGLVLLAPLLGSLVLGWNREFPFSGDSYFHVGQSYRIAYWWLSPVASDVVKVPTLDDVRHLFGDPWSLAWSRITILVVVAAITIGCYRFSRRAALLLATLLLIGWGLREHTIFLRYPGAGYLLDMSFLGLAFFFNNLELGGRLAGVLAAMAWLFILRPWLVGSWPDLRILPAAALLLWQKDVIYYFDSVYLEPWPFVFALLAVEVLIQRGRDGLPIACLLIGTAAAFKEPFILALPLIWLAGIPWRATLRNLIHFSAAGLAAGVPFLVYYGARKSISLDDLGADKVIQLTLSTEGWPHYFREFTHQMNLAFVSTSAIAAFLALAIVPFLLWYRKQDRAALFCAVTIGIGIAVFFMLDVRTQQRWPGYFRFVLYSLPFLAAGAISLGYAVRGRLAAAIGVAILLLQAPSVWIAIARAAGPSTDRNFVEHYDTPIVFPMKSLVAEARRSGVLSPGTPILANLADSTMRALPGSPIGYGEPGRLYCECNGEHPNVLALFVRFANMSKDLAQRPAEPGSRIWNWQNTVAQRDACLAKLQQTCGHVLQRVERGELVAILGAQQRGAGDRR